MTPPGILLRRGRAFGAWSFALALDPAWGPSPEVPAGRLPGGMYWDGAPKCTYAQIREMGSALAAIMPSPPPAQ